MKVTFFLKKDGASNLKGCLQFNQQPRRRESPTITRDSRYKKIASRKDDGRWSFGQEMWTSLSLAPRIRYRDLIEHKIWAVNGEHQTHALALGRGSRRPDLPLWTSAWSGRVHSSYCLPLPSGKTLSFVGKGMLLPLYCAGAKTRLIIKWISSLDQPEPSSL